MSRRTVWGISAFLAAITLAVFGQTVHFDFVNYDDTLYVYENSEVSSGLTWHGLWHALKHGSPANWDPLTTISHMVDFQLYGLHAGGHHLTNVLLHTISVIALFLVLRRMSGELWPSALVAAVFAIHPLRAESVAWVTERKDVLSGLFFVLTIGAYAQYVDKSKVRSPSAIAKAVADKKSKVFYALALFCFVLGLMSKAMLVTLPFLLLLLDVWPLRRFSSGPDNNRVWPPWRLWAEKIPFFTLALVSVVVAGLAQNSANAIETGEPFPLSLRLSNALHSIFAYVWQMFDPAGFAVYYPYPQHVLPAWEWALLAAALVGVTGIVFHWRNRWPYVLVGWLWYLGMLVPVMGVVQLGTQAHADRYTYLPQIGLYIAIIWFAYHASSRWPQRRLVLGCLGVLMVGVLSVAGARQVSYWHDSEALWSRELACGYDDALSHYELGVVYARRGQNQLAIEQYGRAVEIKPQYSEALNNLGNLLLQGGRIDEGIARLREAARIDPGLATAYWNIGMGRLQQGRADDAITNFEQAVKIKPDYLSAHLELATALLAKGRVDDATHKLESLLQSAPNYAEAHNDLGCILLNKGQTGEALGQFQQAVTLKPDYPEAQNNLARVLISQKRSDEAMSIARAVLQAHPDDAGGHYILGSALLQKRRVDEAVAELQTALKLQPGLGLALDDLDEAAWLLATSPDAQARNGARAVELAQQVEKAAGGQNARVLATLAAAYAEAGKFPEAVTTAQQALNLLAGQTDASKTAKLREELAAYQSGRPFRDTGSSAGQ